MRLILVVAVAVALSSCATLGKVQCEDPRTTDPVGCAVCTVGGTPLPVVCPPPPKAAQ